MRAVGKPAHVVDAGVQQVVGVGGRIGDPAAQHVAPLDDGDAKPSVRPRQEMRGHHHPARTAADDQHMRPARGARTGILIRKGAHLCHANDKRQIIPTKPATDIQIRGAT